MLDLNESYSFMQEDIQAMLSWCEELYQNNFSNYFYRQRDLYKKLQSKTRPITDEELEDVLTSLPLDLFTVSEKLHEVQTAHAVIKMKNKQKMNKFKSQSNATTVTQKTEDAEVQMVEDRLIDMAYETIIERVDHEISFSRELIMSAKKIWDRRRQAEGINPISPANVPTDSFEDKPKTFYEQMQASKGQPVYGQGGY